MTRSAYPAALRWALLCAVIVGIICMHHVAADSSDHGMARASAAAGAGDTSMRAPCCSAITGAVSARPADQVGGDHDMLHLCLAILGAAASLLLASMLPHWRRADASPSRSEGSCSFAGRDPPAPRRSSDLLSSLCVLRL